MNQVNKWLSIANTALSNSNIVEDGKVKEVFKGYVSSLGAMIIQNGLPAALAINMKTDSSDKNRIKMVKAITEVLRNSGNAEYIDLNPQTLLNKSCDFAQNNPTQLRNLKVDVIDASIALKLMMRTYQFIE